MASPRIVKVEWARLEGSRPRPAGSNARLGTHGSVTRTPIVRITTDDGDSGFGASFADENTLRLLIDCSLDDLFSFDHGVRDKWLAFDYPIWDLISKRQSLPAYALAARITHKTAPDTLSAPCYDTSLYIDDLHLAADHEAMQLMADEARAGMSRGHTAFKLKIGRGARHMPFEAGMRRDIAIIQEVRRTIGPQATLMLDANNGYNLNLTKHVLEHTADCHIHWMEEAFHEDPVLYKDLNAWLQMNNLPILIADGEGEASTHLLEWAALGLVHVIQYDVISHGFTRWLHTGQRLDTAGIQSAPHHYGVHYGNYVACHLAGVIDHFAFVEWDESSTPGLDGSGYHIDQGQVHVPNLPGFGVDLDDAIFNAALQQSGGALKAK